MSELAKNLSTTALMLVVETLAAKELYDINRTTENFEFLCEKRGKLETYIAELESMVDKLIEAGEIMKQACGDQWGWEDMFDDSEFTDFDDLATGWKERER